MTHQRADAAIFITSGGYTAEARRFAEGKSLQLVDKSGFLDLVKQFQRNLQTHYGMDTEVKPPTVPSVNSANPPLCPVCQSSMKLRTAKKGRNAGSQFWGCSRFPGCNGVIDIK
jgi:restriction system protein